MCPVIGLLLKSALVLAVSILIFCFSWCLRYMSVSGTGWAASPALFLTLALPWSVGHSQGWQLEPPTVSRTTAGGLYASSSSSVTSGKSRSPRLCCRVSPLTILHDLLTSCFLKFFLHCAICFLQQNYFCFFSLVTLLPRNSDCKWFLNFSVCLSVEMFLRTVYVDFSMPCLLTARNSAPAEFSAQLTLSYRIWRSTHDRQIWPNICRIQGFSIQIFSFICWPCS